MTLEQMIEEVWEALGEESDLNPYDSSGTIDTGSWGFRRLRKALNMAQTQVAQWKDPSTGAPLNFSELFGEMYFETASIEGALLAVEGQAVTCFAESDGSLSAAELELKWGGRYDGWVLVVGSQMRVVVDTIVDGSDIVLMVDDAFDGVEAGDDFTLCKRFSFLLPQSHRWADEHITVPGGVDLMLAEGGLISPLKIIDVSEGFELEVGDKPESYALSARELGQPRRWYFLGRRLYFDRAPQEARWYRMEYYRNPLPMVAPADSPEIPEPFHYPMVLWAIEWGYRRNGESAEKYSTKRDFVDLMRSIKSGYDIAPQRQELGGRLRVRRRS